MNTLAERYARLRLAVVGDFCLDRYLEIDPARLESFKAATKEVGDTSVREEAGCLVLYAVSEKEKSRSRQSF